MPTLNYGNPTLLDLAKRTDPNGQIATIVEILNATNEILEDMTWVEGNLPTGMRTTVRTGIPAPTWRKLYGGVQPTKSTTAQITDSCGMLEAYAEVDKALADLNGNTQEFRLSETKPHIEGMNQEVAKTLFYGNESATPERFTGFHPRFNALTGAENSQNIINGGGLAGQLDCTSIWLIVWGPNTVHGIVPKGSTAGLKMEDKGQVTIENVDGAGGRMEAYRTHFRWDVGLTVRDWRYIVRIANIDRSLLTKDAASGADITDLMVQAEEMVPSLNSGRAAWYVARDVKAWLRRQLINKTKNSTLTQENQAGKIVTYFDGIPVRRVDAISGNENALT